MSFQVEVILVNLVKESKVMKEYHNYMTDTTIRREWSWLIIPIPLGRIPHTVEFG
jgi:hypothetical protein